jgi:2-keto-4-pentenoate hydratase/2-oxohepta-3-ene-1,7-dioic acid hydratase in catechol pathway
MRLARVGPPGAERPVVVGSDGRLLDLTSLTQDIDGAFLSGQLPDLDPSELPELADPGRRGPPVARPGKVVGIGLNYTSYAAAVGVDPPTEPVVFLKASTSVCGPTDTVRGLPGSLTTDHEVELGVVIGQRLSGVVDAARARSAVAGYLLANDVTDRALAGVGGPWAKGKCADTFCPIGPWLVTPDELGDPRDVELCLSVNHEVRQHARTSEMVFDVPTLLIYLSGLMTLEPGDLILTGTPAGVAVARPEPKPYLRDGDVIELTATGLGAQRTPFAAHAAP